MSYFFNQPWFERYVPHTLSMSDERLEKPPFVLSKPRFRQEVFFTQILSLASVLMLCAVLVACSARTETAQVALPHINAFNYVPPNLKVAEPLPPADFLSDKNELILPHDDMSPRTCCDAVLPEEQYNDSAEKRTPQSR